MELIYWLTFSHPFLAVLGQKSETGRTRLMRTSGRGCLPPRAPGTARFRVFLSHERCPCASALGPFLGLQSQQRAAGCLARVASPGPGPCLPLSLIMTLVMTPDPPNTPESSQLKTLNLTTYGKSRWPREMTHSQVPGIKAPTSLETITVLAPYGPELSAGHSCSDRPRSASGRGGGAGTGPAGPTSPLPRAPALPSSSKWAQWPLRG